MEIKVPEIGDYADVPVIEIHVAPGDVVQAEDPLVTLETDKAAMDIPAPFGGTIVSVSVKVGDSVSEGTVIAIASDTADDVSQDAAQAAPETVIETEAVKVTPDAPVDREAPVAAPGPVADGDGAANGLRATPLVRRLARNLEVDLVGVSGTGGKGRVTKQDLLAHYEGSIGSRIGATSGMGIPPIPDIDFAKFGPVRTVPLSRIKKIAGPHLHRSWLNVPHVTHSDEADITALDSYRRELDAAAKEEGYRVTMLSFLLKAVAVSLRKYPVVNSSLAGEELALKDYVNIGVAVDTPDGLVVPVVTDVDRKGITELSRDLGDLSARARDGKLSAGDMQGATFTISSLGGIGGTAFTPIVNAPEVAILGVVRSKMAPVWNGIEFEPRLMLPLCLSYDHRVIDGALAARFTVHLAHLVGDVRRLVL